ncbi:SusC/RagA family TonB-linked outer membrane protein [Chitinophaga ginsengisegetis]|nr:SusC/RagA family TonB-linked outer membrane protein [Chitinophaga ginsengisegetis]
MRKFCDEHPLPIVKSLLRTPIHMAVLLTFTMLLFCMSARAQISMKVKNEQLDNVLQQVRKQSGYNLVYDVKMVRQKGKPVAVDLKNVSVQQAMQAIFHNQDLAWEITSARTIFVREKVQYTTNQTVEVQQNVHGNIINEAGEPMPGVSIKIKNVNYGTVTDRSGDFTLPGAFVNAILVITAVNMEPMEFALDGRLSVTIIARKKEFALQGVTVTVNTGYQTLSRERATGSFAKPDMNIFSQRAGTMNVIARLEGLVPGMTVIPGARVINTTRDGGTSGQQSLIRGRASIELNPDPLYVVNGIQVPDIESINPDDIADITVLKDAAAAAIWGARAANGVVVITTKTGTKNNRLKFNYSGMVNIQGRPDFNYMPMMNSSQYIGVARQLFDPVNYPWNTLSNGVITPHEKIMYDRYRGHISSAQENASLDSLAALNNASQISDIWYRNASTTNHTLSLSAGTSNYSFYGSLAYTNVTSNRPGERNNTYRINFNQQFTPNKIIKATLITALSQNEVSSKRPIQVDNSFIPYQLFRDSKGQPLSMPYVQGWSDSLRNDYATRSRLNLDYNPLGEMSQGNSNSTAVNINVSGTLEIALPIKGLSFQGNYGYIRNQVNSSNYDDIAGFALRKELLGFTVAPTAASTPVYYLPTTGGSYSTANQQLRNWTVRNQLVYSFKDQTGNHQLGVQAGQDIQEQAMIMTGTKVRGYNNALQTYSALDYKMLSNGVMGTMIPWASRLQELPFNKTEDVRRIVSYFTLVNYEFDHKYNLDMSWRMDHSNLFGTDRATQNRPVWSVGSKWRVGREPFMENVAWVSDLALRATYGITGNSPYSGGASSYDILMGDSWPSYGGPSLNIITPANRRLAWEMSRTTNIGLDFSLLKQRINVGVDLYQKKTTDLLGGYSTNPLTGFISISGNIGEMENKGVELSLKTVNINAAKFRWQSNLIFSYNKNKLVDYTPPSVFANSASSRVRANYIIGYSMQSLWAYRFAGLDNMGDPMIWLSDKTKTKSRNVATVEDVQYMGTVIPPFNGSISNMFTYGAFSLDANIVFNLGHVMRRDVNTFYTGRLTGAQGLFNGNIRTDFENRWKKPGDEQFTSIPSYVSNENESFFRRDIQYYALGDVNVVSASYIKLRDITLAWNMPARIAQAMRLGSARVFVQTTNYMLWKANKDNIDPEYHMLAEGIRLLPGFSHAYNLGANISF